MAGDSDMKLAGETATATDTKEFCDDFSGSGESVEKTEAQANKGIG